MNYIILLPYIQTYVLFDYIFVKIVQGGSAMSHIPDYKRKSHSVYLLTYHIVFVTKYRKPVISDEIGDFMKDHAAYLCGRFQGELLSAETDRDHIHLLVSLPPDVAPSGLVAVLKTQISKEVRAAYADEIRKYLWGKAFWSDSYFIATTGTTVMEKVKEYIESQRSEEHRRKYEKSGKYSKKKKQ